MPFNIDLPFGLGAKDVLGPIISGIAAIFSLVFFLRSQAISKRMAARSLNLEAQKMLLELNRQLISDPWLWVIYDKHKLREASGFACKSRDPVFQAKLEALAYLKLNMLEVILAEIPKSERTIKPNVWARIFRKGENTWVTFFRYTVKNSDPIRQILDKDENAQLYNQAVIKLYRQIKDHDKSLAPEDHSRDIRVTST
jgi:hypothetical protein